MNEALTPEDCSDRPEGQANNPHQTVQEHAANHRRQERFNRESVGRDGGQSHTQGERSTRRVGAAGIPPALYAGHDHRGQPPQPLARDYPLPTWQRLPVKHKVQYLSSVTTCLAALGDNRRSIVTVVDTKLAWGDSGAYGYKAHPIHNHWQVLYAGDVTACTAALGTLARTVDHTPKQHGEMVNHIVEGFAANPCALGCTREFLLAGFDDRGFPHVSVITDAADHDPSCVDWTQGGYGAIGSGGCKARVVLGQFHHRITRTVWETLYCACAAKFFSEDASDVGEETLAYVLRPGGHTIFIPDALIADFRAIWKGQGQLPIPNDALLAARKQLDIA
jgi:hypothetical protein